MSPGLEMMIKEYDASTVDDEYSDVSPIYSLAQRQETEMSCSQRHSWDICEKLLPRVSEYDSFQQWPDGHCKFVYSASDDIEAGRHMSGWAMRNTNNHNALVLKKSCLGVLACSRPCLDADSKPLVNLRPAICDKARAKQIGRPCPTQGCDGHLMLKPCEGHGGYPVTHFWRTANSSVYFQSKGSHSHQRPIRFWPLVERRQRATNNDNNKRQPLPKAKKFLKKSRSESENSEIRISSKSTKASSSSSSSSSSAAAAAAAVTLNSFDCNFPMYSPVTKYSEWSHDTRRPPGPVSRGFQPETFGQRLLITTGTGSDWEHGTHLNASYEEEFWIRQYQDQCHDQGQAEGQGQWQPIYQRNYDQGSMCSKDFVALQPYHPGIGHCNQHHHHHHHHSHSLPCSSEYMHSYGINRPLKVEECYSCYDGGPSTGLCNSSSSSSRSRSSSSRSTAAVRFVASNDAEGRFFPSEMEHFWTLQQTYDPETHLAPFYFSEPSSSSYVTQSPPSFYEQKALVTSSPSMFDSYIPLDTLHVLDPEQVEEEFRRMEPQSMEFNCQMQQGANAPSGGHFQLKIEGQK